MSTEIEITGIHELDWERQEGRRRGWWWLLVKRAQSRNMASETVLARVPCSSSFWRGAHLMWGRPDIPVGSGPPWNRNRFRMSNLFLQISHSTPESLLTVSAVLVLRCTQSTHASW